MEEEGMYAYRYRDTLLILKMTLKVLFGFILISPIFLLRYGRMSFVELLTQGIFAILFIAFLWGIMAFVIIFLLFYIVDKPLLFPEVHPLTFRNIRLISLPTDPPHQSSSPASNPAPALQVRLFIPQSNLGQAISYYFPCPIFFPRNAGLKSKLLNTLDIPIPFDAKNNEIFRCAGLFKTRNNLHQKVRGDLYIKVRIIRTAYYYLFLLLIVIIGFGIYLGILIYIQNLGIFPVSP